MSKKVAIIGAGISGLSCARALHDHGFTVDVFEKSRGLGGRMSTRRGADWQCDHGAQYFTARDPLFKSEVERWRQGGLAAIWTPRVKVIGSAGNNAAGERPVRYVGMPTMNAPLRAMASGLPVQTMTRITDIFRHNGQWMLQAAEVENQYGDYSAVIIAVPPAQAESLLRDAAPRLADTAGLQHMRPCWSVMARYATPPLPDCDALFVNEGPLRWVARDGSKPGRTSSGIWLLHANADWSSENLALAPEVAGAALLAEFQNITGAAPASFEAHRWLYADAGSYMQQRFVWDGRLGIGLCGDWLNGGKVEGAWLSGFHLAQAISSDPALHA